ncbi:MAG: alpha/beta hydrolase [Candidatus Eremiobacteraeota bacterium]|nr:alpha/beta hydrolase [Candidatus Eremiobacteraeota bacterium]
MASWQSRALRLGLRAFVKRPLQANSSNRGASIAAMRRSAGGGAARYVRVPRDTRIVTIEGPSLRGEWVLPRAASETYDRAILYVHGGAMVACRPVQFRAFTIPLARATGVPVFVVDYRLAPEHRYPAALDDVVAAFEAMTARIPGRRIVIAGDSAGGNLALAALLALRAKRGEPKPVAGIVALSPWTDLGGTGASGRENARSDDMLVVSEGDARIALAYADEAAFTDPLVSPLYGDYSGAPPLLVFASTIELVRDDAVRLVEKARAQGVDVEFVLEADMPHVWPVFQVIPEAKRALVTMREFMERCWSVDV